MKKYAVLFLMMAVILLLNGTIQAQGMGSAFTYQGRLNDDGSAANGVYDLEFRLYDALTGGSQIDTTKLMENVNVYDSYFTVSLDFGVPAFNGDPRWLQIGVRPGASTERPTALTPRQPVSPNPYAIYAARSDWLNLINIPGDIADGDDDSTLSESQVDAYVANNGYLDGSYLPDWDDLLDIPAGFADGIDDIGAGDSDWSGAGTGKMYAASTSDNVGIGTTNPSAKLAVQWDAANNSNPIAEIKTTGINSEAALRFKNANNDFYNLGMTGENYFALAYNNNISYATDIFRVTPTGWVGMGVASPQQNLHIQGDSVNDVTLLLENLDTTGTEQIYFGPTSGSNAAMMVWGSDHATMPGKWRFANNKTAGNFDWITSGNIRMTLTNDGNLGLGTATPAHRLDVNGSIGADGLFSPAIMHLGSNIDIELTVDATNSAIEGTFEVFDGAGEHLLWVSENNFARINARTAIGGILPMTTYQLRVVADEETPYAGWFSTLDDTDEAYGVYGKAGGTGGTVHYGVYGYACGAATNWAGYFDGNVYAAGNVGIGTTDPYAKTHIVQNTNADALRVDDQGSDPTPFVIDATGDVGIGTVFPQYKLDVGNVSDSYNYIRIGASDYTGVLFYDGLNDASGAVVYDHTGDFLRFDTSSSGNQISEKMRITSEGNVGIGTAVPGDYKLNVNGNLKVQDNISVDDIVYLYGLTGTTSGDTVRYYNNRLYFYSSSAQYKEDIQPLNDDFTQILQAQPKSFIDQESRERNIGFIAEELDELGLNHLVSYKDNQPNAVKYELVSLYLLEIVKQHEQTTRHLLKENEALKNQLAQENQSLKQEINELKKNISRLMNSLEGEEK